MKNTSKYKVNGKGWHHDNAAYRAATGTLFYFERRADYIDEVIDFASANGFDIEQRYTDLQIELLQKDEGWIVWDYDKSPVSQGLVVDLHAKCGAVFLSEKSRDSIDWENVNAYRLTCDDLHINGERVVLREGDYLRRQGSEEWRVKRAFEYANLEYIIGSTHIGSTGYSGGEVRLLTLAQALNAENAKPKEFEQVGRAIRTKTPVEPEWKEGELPTVGVECEFMPYQDEPKKVKILGNVNSGDMWMLMIDDNEYYTESCMTPDQFRPIQSHRDKVIKKASNLARAHHWTAEDYLIELYGAGMLIEGGE